MTKEQFEDRIKLLEVEREQIKATFNATEGAIQDCKYWLSQLELVNNNDG